MSTIKASRNWPYYQGKPVHYDRRTGRFYIKVRGRMVEIRNTTAQQSRRDNSRR